MPEEVVVPVLVVGPVDVPVAEAVPVEVGPVPVPIDALPVGAVALMPGSEILQAPRESSTLEPSRWQQPSLSQL